jgi:hypothetical protein
MSTARVVFRICSAKARKACFLCGGRLSAMVGYCPLRSEGNGHGGPLSAGAVAAGKR